MFIPSPLKEGLGRNKSSKHSRSAGHELSLRQGLNIPIQEQEPSSEEQGQSNRTKADLIADTCGNLILDPAGPLFILPGIDCSSKLLHEVQKILKGQ